MSATASMIVTIANTLTFVTERGTETVLSRAAMVVIPYTKIARAIQGRLDSTKDLGPVKENHVLRASQTNEIELGLRMASVEEAGTNLRSLSETSVTEKGIGTETVTGIVMETGIDIGIHARHLVLMSTGTRMSETGARWMVAMDAKRRAVDIVPRLPRLRQEATIPIATGMARGISEVKEQVLKLCI